MGGTQISISEAIFLGIIQGLTEFLPISSSGHLVFFQTLFGIGGNPLFFDVMLHLGTLLAVIIFFRKDILKIFRGIVGIWKGRSNPQEGKILLLWIILATLPTGLIGLLFKDWFESLFSEPRITAGMLLITGSGLWLTRWVKREGRPLPAMRWIDALLIGIAQGVAIIPGISRSGATISVGLFCGLDREPSGRFSFLLSIPAILGATLLELRKISSPSELRMVLTGTATAFVIGFLSLTFLMKMIKLGKLSYFSYYCFAVGLLVIFLIK